MRNVYRACGYETGRCSMSRVEDKDLGLKRIVNTLYAELDDVVVKVGVQAKDKAARRGKGGSIRNTDQPLAVIAAVHEFGLGGMPQRSFLRSAYDENKPTIDAMVDNIANNAVQGMSVGTALNQLGNVVQGRVQRKIVDGPFKPNSLATIKRKRSSRPLIDTGHLRQSIRYVIEKGGSDNE
nr:MAG TPA: virion morphogenesis protein [Caudoviricetes sp.]